MEIKITIADRSSDRDALANLFSRNLSAQYISHSELQSSRAIKPGQWAPGVELILRNEIAQRLNDSFERFPDGRDWWGIVQAKNASSLVGLAFVTLTHNAAVPFGTIEDIVVDKPHRGKGYGKLLMEWIVTGFLNAGIRRAFLESGRDNELAHRLFEQLGFETISIVMMRDL